MHRLVSLLAVTAIISACGGGGGSSSSGNTAQPTGPSPTSEPTQPTNPVTEPTNTTAGKKLVKGQVVDTALTVPSNLTQVERSKAETQLAFSWNYVKATSDEDVANILIYRNSYMIKRYAIGDLANQFIDHHLTPDTSYQYHVRTETSTGVVSAASDALSLKTTAFAADSGYGLRKNTRAYDFSYIDLDPKNCAYSPVVNANAIFSDLYVGQTHMSRPTNERHTTRQDGGELTQKKGYMPKFALVHARPALAQVQVKGSGLPPELKLGVYFTSAAGKTDKVGEVCMTKPANLSSGLTANFPVAVDDVPSHKIADTYTANLRPEWVRKGMSLKLMQAGNTIENVPVDKLVVEAPSQFHFVDIYADTKQKDFTMPSWASEYEWLAAHPVRDAVNTTFPKQLWSKVYKLPKNIVKELGYAGSSMAYKNWGKIGSGVAGLGSSVGNGGYPVRHHEMGHAAGLGHEGSKTFYPYSTLNAARADGKNWGSLRPPHYSQYHNQVVQYGVSLKRSGRRVPMFTDYFQRRVGLHYAKISQWDENIIVPTEYQATLGRQRGGYVKWDASAQKFVFNPAQVDINSYFPAQRNVPVVLLTGIYDPSNKQSANTTEATRNANYHFRERGETAYLNDPVYYEGHYRYRIAPDLTDTAFTKQLRDNVGFYCQSGCNAMLKATYTDGSQRLHLLEATNAQSIGADQTTVYAAVMPHADGKTIGSYALQQLSVSLINRKFSRAENRDNTLIPANHISKFSDAQLADLAKTAKTVFNETRIGEHTGIDIPAPNNSFTADINQTSINKDHMKSELRGGSVVVGTDESEVDLIESVDSEDALDSKEDDDEKELKPTKKKG